MPNRTKRRGGGTQRSRPTRFRGAGLDPFVAAADNRLAPLRQPEPKDPAERRRLAKIQDDATIAELGIRAVDVATKEHILAVEGHPEVRLRVYWPSAQPLPPVDAGGVPVLVYYYGGAFTLAGIDWLGWDALFRRRAEEAGVIVVAGDYAHAPEVQFPSQPEQCWTVFEWAATHAHELGGDPGRLAVGGASSGANLAAAVTLMNRDRNRRPLRLQILEAPALDLTMGHIDVGAVSVKVPDAILRRLGVRLVRQYLGRSRRRRRHPYASPLLAPSLAGLPPAAIYTSELDPLRGDGEAYARALGAAGVPATAVRYIGQTHTSGGLIGVVPAADHLHRDIVATLRTLHEDASSYPDLATASR